MTTQRFRKTSGIRLFDQDDLYGRISVPGAKSLFTDRKIRRLAHGRIHFYHRQKNGIHDPFTFFHVVETLLQIEPGERFNAAELVEWLNANRPAILWDTTTVGRVLNDIRESFDETHGPDHQPISIERTSRGAFYTLANAEPARVTLVRLADDLTRLCERAKSEEADGIVSARAATPLIGCPSLALEVDLAA